MNSRMHRFTKFLDYYFTFADTNTLNIFIINSLFRCHYGKNTSNYMTNFWKILYHVQ